MTSKRLLAFAAGALLGLWVVGFLRTVCREGML